MVPLYSLLLLLLLLLLLFPLLTASLIPSKLIQATCNATTHYDLCISSLESDPNSLKANNTKVLSAISISIALSNAVNSSSYVSDLAKNATNTALGAVLGACARRYVNARESLQWALDALSEESYDYAALHVGGAKEYPGMCRGLFWGCPGLSYPVEMASREGELEGLCALALDMISLLG